MEEKSAKDQKKTSGLVIQTLAQLTAKMEIGTIGDRAVQLVELVLERVTVMFCRKHNLVVVRVQEDKRTHLLMLQIALLEHVPLTVCGLYGKSGRSAQSLVEVASQLEHARRLFLQLMVVVFVRAPLEKKPFAMRTLAPKLAFGTTGPNGAAVLPAVPAVNAIARERFSNLRSLEAKRVLAKPHRRSLATLGPVHSIASGQLGRTGQCALKLVTVVKPSASATK